MPDGIFFFALSGIVLWLIKIFLRNLRKGVDKYKKIVYNVGTKEREVNKMKKITIKEILIGAVAEKLGCSEYCLRNYTKAQLKEILEKED